jgi:membrane protein implicated in regulation of membrane protease activity
MLIYAGIALVGFLFLLIMLFVGDIFGGDHDLVGHDVSGEFGGPGVFSSRIMAAFITAFGVGGIVARYYELSHPAASGVGIASGAVMAGLVYQFAKILYSQQASSELQMTRLVGRTAEVSVAIPAHGVGQITLSVSGERTEHVARSKDGQALPRGSEVVITELRGDSVVVSQVSGGSQ